ncbi:MAG: DUF3106 domain-containing protein [Opitutales bacterium]|nr:DUF3106 domain-containing protein [Opitutales bacterium]
MKCLCRRLIATFCASKVGFLLICGLPFSPAETSGQALQPPPPPPALPDEILRTRPPGPPPAPPDESALREQMQLLDQFLQLPPEKLARMRQTIEMIERMEEEERELLRIRIRQFTEMTPELRSELRQMGEALPMSSRQVFGQYWLSLNESQREDWRSRLKDLNAADRAEKLRPAIEEFEAHLTQIFTEMRRRSTSTGAARPPPSSATGSR